MRVGRWFASFALIAALLLVPVAPPARADDGTATDVVQVDVGVETDSWIGGLAVVGCGLFVRATIVTGGTQVATYVGAVACCGYALFDLLVVDPH